MKNSSPFAVVLLLASGALAATVAGCHSDAAASKPAQGANVAAASAAAMQQPSGLTRSDLNPAMSDRQKDMLLRHKNRL